MMFKLKIRGLFNGFTLVDLLLLLIFPGTITLLMLLPEPIRLAMQLNIKNPQWWQFITASFIHQNWQPHLSGNLIGYFLFVFPLFFLIATMSKNKKKYYAFLLFTILTFPIFATFFQLHYLPKSFPNMTYSCGSSGIIAVLVGLIPAFWILCIISKNSAFKFRKRFAILSFSYALLALELVYFSTKNIVLLSILGLIFLSSLIFYGKSLLFILVEIGKEASVNVIAELTLILVPVLFITAPFIFLFPPISFFNKVAIQTGTGIDFYTHFFGLIYGLSISLTYFLIMDKSTKRI